MKFKGFILALFCLCATSSSTFAQDDRIQDEDEKEYENAMKDSLSTTSVSGYDDTSLTDLNLLHWEKVQSSPDTIYNDLRSDPRFDYKVDKEASILPKKRNDTPPRKTSKFWELFFRRTLWIILGGLLVLFVIYSIYTGRGGGPLYILRKRRIKARDVDDNILETDWASLEREAVAKGDWILALRYTFLQSLRNLADAGLIKWNPRKTNEEYLLELKGNAARAPFKNLINLFNKTWYGGFNYGQQEHDLVVKVRQELNTTILANPITKS